jgi:histidyl-tRNA synthetase
MADRIEPRTLKGFRDYPPDLMIPREGLLEKARNVFRSHGYAPIDTPAMEYAEILLGKGGAESDKIIYRFQDNGGRDVALRFDLTVPFARFAAQYIGQLGTPFKRYAMGPVWRGENTGHGRYREFWQCDFDTIGTTANAADVEVVLVIYDLMRALGFEKFSIRVNNRLVLNGLLEMYGLADRAVPLLRALDKLPKIGAEKVIAEMTESGPDKGGVTREQAEKVLLLATVEGTNTEILGRIESEFGSNERAAEGVRRLRELTEVTRAVGIPDQQVRLDLSIARGLDYYTGTIYETFLDDLPKIGSVCSGGRYDDLAGVYTKQTLPGVGASLGLDRLVAAMEELKMLGGSSTPAQVLVVQFVAGRLADYQKVASRLRAAGVGVEVYPEAKKIGQQLQYAERRGYRLAVIAGPDELEQKTWKLKDLARREEQAYTDEEIIRAVKDALAVKTPG